MTAYSRTNYKRAREVVFYIASGNCMIPKCKNEANECHHIDGNPLNNALINLIPLCSSCHSYAHRSRINFSYWPKLIAVRFLNKARLFYSLYGGEDLATYNSN